MRSALVALVVLACCSSLAYAGGSNYGVAPGAKEISGKISEWPVPTPKFARDPAIGPDGNIYIAVMQGNRIARFDTKTQTFTEWELPPNAKPHGLVVDAKNIVWYTGNGNGTIGALDPRSGRVLEHKVPLGGDPHTLVIADDGIIWFTVQGGGRIGRLDPRSSRITEYKTSGSPYGLALDKQGNVWFCRFSADSLGRLDPKTGEITTLPTGPGSRPRRIAAAPDGTLWVTYYGSGKLAQVDPVARKVVREVDLPAGAAGGAYAVTVDGKGRVWANEIQTDTVALLDPGTLQFRVFKLPSSGVGIRKAIIDGEGRYWYMGSHNGRLGVIE